MTIEPTPPWPHFLSEIASSQRPSRGDELGALRALDQAGVEVATVTVVPAAVEERFYRLNNLPERLLSVFADVDPADPDEDDLEERAPEAVRLIERHFLLEEFIDAFYEHLEPLPGRIVVRRAGGSGQEAARGRPALLALKRLWASDWTFDALVDRLQTQATFALEARDVFVHGVDAPATERLAGAAHEVLGRGFDIWATPQAAVTRAIPAGSKSNDDHV